MPVSGLNRRRTVDRLIAAGFGEREAVVMSAAWQLKQVADCLVNDHALGVGAEAALTFARQALAACEQEA